MPESIVPNNDATQSPVSVGANPEPLMVGYSLLIKYNPNDVRQDSVMRKKLMNRVHEIEQRGVIVRDIVFEHGEDNKMHIHATAWSLNKLYYKRFQKKNYLTSFKPLRDKDRYLNYLKKEMEMNDINEYFSTYRFRDT